jgi:hypothetical protein
VYLHGRKGLGKKDRKWWHCDKILVHLKEFEPIVNFVELQSQPLHEK